MLYDDMYMDLNTDYNKSFKQACDLIERELSHDEIIEMLKTGNIPEKQFAALSLDCIRNKEEGDILIGNLTGCDGKIREAIALKINRLVLTEPDKISLYICSGSNPEIFADASVDINANICRLVIDSVSVLKQNEAFSEIYLKKILGFIDETFKEIDKFIFRDKKYVINKQLFKLYWCLESLKLFVNELMPEDLLKILERASAEKEYTIREKVAQILNLTDNKIFHQLIEKLKSDENYYVRTALQN